MSRSVPYPAGGSASQLPKFADLFRDVFQSGRLTALRSLDSTALPQAFRAYVELVTFVRAVGGEATSAKATDQNAPSGLTALTSQLVSMTTSVWNALVKTLSR